MPGFPKSERLLKRADFLRISGQGQKIHTANFIVLWKESSAYTVRVGITVSRKVGNAVTRNRLKRLVRECYRKGKELFPPADYNIIAKQGAARLGLRDVCQELDRALRRLSQQQC